ncbi:hypothetical protein [Paraburkholderia haematera]|uniref:Uncharacterized protein n=1 Tax=Paraburkholderia haematera TaxID=2793077 RepID=A0ABM8QQ17_9BURK|nr:hypothetical protein [Paraburkholderia haematera]CAE6709158.1 hypothetical protein R69888_01049 [Paraburkholderia haematera]
MQDLSDNEWIAQTTYCVAELYSQGTRQTFDLGKFQSNLNGHAEDNLIAALVARTTSGAIAHGTYDLLIILNRSPCTSLMPELKANHVPACMTRLIDLQENGLGNGTWRFNIQLNYRHLYGGNPSSNWNRALNAFGVQQGAASGIGIMHGVGYYDVGVAIEMSKLQ